MGLSQKEAARELGRSQGLIAQIESGKRRLSPEDSKTWDKFRKRHYSGSRTSPDKKAAKTCKD
ncbi:MAG: helix-turn-helix protein [Candidatus Aminicenantes bacterium ADurb.Bin508]|nr:MAG: helix-turn-helix protein [Candidatus Aminicenantes bacterium ADurb.Bin508]